MEIAPSRPAIGVEVLPAAKKRKQSLQRRTFEFFNAGPGTAITAPLTDLRFHLWKLRHSQASFADYYAYRNSRNLASGGSHKTLGARAFLSGRWFGAPRALTPHELRKRGRKYFAAALLEGLEPRHLCVDYGCGSLRIGQHLMNYLEPGRYWGLDVVADFYEAGKKLLPPGLLQTKDPQFRVIGPSALTEIRLLRPDFILSFAVMKHVPPEELRSFFGNIALMMAAGTRAFITFTQECKVSRVGGKIWAYDEKLIASTLRQSDAGLTYHIKPLNAAKANGDTRTSVLLLRRDAGSED